MAIDRDGGRSRATITRSPAGLHSPEDWRIAVADASRTTIEIVGLVSRGARTSSGRHSARGPEIADGRQRRPRLGQVDPVVTPDQAEREVV